MAFNNAANGHSAEPLQWNVGLLNFQNKYLTAETFGFKINASGTTMRKKQMWVIEHDPQADDIIYIRSHLGRYLSTDRRGNVTCNSEHKGPEQSFAIVYERSKSGSDSGRWAIQNAAFGTYFGGTEDKLSCNEKNPRSAEWWTVHLAVHPQVNLRNVNRKKYAVFDIDTEDRILVNTIIPWGEEAIITMEFAEGKYALKSCNNRYLHREGYLEDERDEDTMFTLEIRSGVYSGLALKDVTGRYLSAVGMDAVIQGRNKTIGKDELWTIEDSHPQVFLVAHNKRKVSIKQSVDLSANQDDDDITDTETFQLEYDKKAESWRVRCNADTMWSLEAASGIQAVAKDRKPKGLFKIEWLPGGSIAMKANNGRYITAKMNGSLYATSDSITDKEKFVMTILNRPIFVVKCEYGYWGFKAQGNPRVECNKHNYDIMFLEHTWGESGVYYIKGLNRMYFRIDAEGHLNSDSKDPVPFYFELKGQSRMVIKSENGNYLKGEQNGQLTAKLADISKATLWEY